MSGTRTLAEPKTERARRKLRLGSGPRGGSYGVFGFYS